jgi:hypothetical protein
MTRDALDPPSLVDSRKASLASNVDTGFVLPAKLKRSASLASVVAAKPSAPSSLPADVASLLTTDAIDRKMDALESKTLSAATPPGPTAIKIPRAISQAEASPRPLAASGGIALTGPSEIDSAELVEALLASRELMSEVKQVSHEVADSAEPRESLDPPRPVAIKDVPPLMDGHSSLGVAAPAPADLKPAAMPRVDSQLVTADADEELLKRTSVVPVVSQVASTPVANMAGSVPVGDAPLTTPSAKADFVVERFHFCSEINGFGSTVARPAGPMVPGERLLAYVEVMNFESTVNDGMFETKLSCRMKLENAAGQIVFSQEFGDIVDRCVGRRQDFFCHFLLTVPETLPPGKYRWKILLTDNTRNKTSEAALETEIGSGEPGERNDLQ